MFRWLKRLFGGKLVPRHELCLGWVVKGEKVVKWRREYEREKEASAEFDNLNLMSEAELLVHFDFIPDFMEIRHFEE